jgi:hypothetical protein
MKRLKMLGSALLVAAIAGTGLFAAAAPASASGSFSATVANRASGEGGNQALGSILRIQTSVPVGAEANYSPFTSTPGGINDGLRVNTSDCNFHFARDLPIISVAPGGTRIDVYYPGPVDHGFGVCTSQTAVVFTVNRANAFGGGASWPTTVQMVAAKPGIFEVNDAGFEPDGQFYSPVSGYRAISECNASPSSCVLVPGSSFLILYTTGGEALSCSPCPGNTIRFELSRLSPDGFFFVSQPVDFYGFAGFTGQEQANVRITVDDPGVYVVRVADTASGFISSKFLRVTFGVPA